MNTTRSCLSLVRLSLAAVSLTVVGATGCAAQPVYRTQSDPLQTVAAVDLSRYVGRWYEVHRLPNGFEDADCATVTADYAMRDDGLVAVTNSCVKHSGVERSTGVARIVDPVTNAKLEVSFFRPFYGNYWIIDLTDDYGAVLVAEPAGKYMWILGRTAVLPPEVEARMMGRAKALGYPLDKLLSPANVLPAPPL